MNNKIKEYAKTVIFSIIIVTFLCFVAELELLFRTEKSVTYKQLNVANLSKFCTIEELEKKLAQNPDDYFINIRLGQMYETIGKLDKANDFYKNALKLSGRSNFALYSYALFCAKNDLYVFAATLAEELEGTSNNVNLYRAKIYEQIAKSLDKAKNYPAATKSYQIVYKYAKSIGDMKYLSQVKSDYSEEYVKLADYHIEQEDIEQAVCDLENSLKIKETPIANYKLGLIYLTSDLEKAEKHINKAIFKDPFIVNPYIYNSVLTKLISQAELLNNGGLLNYYSSRMNRFKKLLKTSYLYKNQVVVENSALVKTKKLFKKEKTTLFFELKNNTDDVLKDLLIKVELFVNGEKYVMEKKIVTPLNQIEPYETLKSTDFVLSDDVKFGNLKQNDDVFVRYFARRTDDAPWILIKIDFINN